MKCHHFIYHLIAKWFSKAYTRSHSPQLALFKVGKSNHYFYHHHWGCSVTEFGENQTRLTYIFLCWNLIKIIRPISICCNVGFVLNSSFLTPPSLSPCDNVWKHIIIMVNGRNGSILDEMPCNIYGLLQFWGSVNFAYQILQHFFTVEDFSITIAIKK